MPDDGYFDERIAATYDESAADMFTPEVVDPVIDFLAEIAGDGRALELGIGTGRIALPLAQRGVPVHGIDVSRAMVARMRLKPGGEDIAVTIGDFETTAGDGSFALAYLVFNTINNLTTQEAQVACFRNVAAHLQPGGSNVAAHLQPGGSFVIEVGIPDLRRLPPGQTLHAFHMSEQRFAHRRRGYGRRVHRPKWGKSREVAIASFLVSALERHLGEHTAPDAESLVFSATNGAPLRASNYSTQVHWPAMKTAGLGTEVKVHDLRHSAAAAMIAVNPNPLLVCKQLGHSSIRTTFDLYGHLFPDHSAKLMSALDDQWTATIENVGPTT